jgi:HEAT repeat protein
LDLRLQAALSLVELGDRGGVELLRELVEEAPYLAERGQDPRRWAPQTVSLTRIKVLGALERLGEPLPADVLRRLAQDDPDPNVRAAALELSSRGAGSGPDGDDAPPPGA